MPHLVDAWKGNSTVTASLQDEHMKIQSSDRTGILIVHLWIEENAREGFRARITQTLDSAAPDQLMATAATPDDLLDVVKAWVEGFVSPN
jgi:hypothetical protein